MVASPWSSPLLTDVFICTCIALCITQSAVFSGLNLAIFSISKLRLEVAPSTTSSASDCASSPRHAMPTCCSLPARSPATCARRSSAPTRRRQTRSGWLLSAIARPTASYAVAGGVNTVVPVDLHISGCPPTPRQLAGGTSGAPRNAMFNLAACLTVTKDFFWHPAPHPTTHASSAGERGATWSPGRAV